MFSPLMIDLKDRNIVIVGGGRVAYRKAEKLNGRVGKLYLISPDLIDEFNDLDINYIKGEFSEEICPQDIFLYIGASNSRQVNERVYHYSKARGILVNIVDSLEESDLIFPAWVKNDGLDIFISTYGKFPSLAKRLRLELEEKYKKYDREFLDNLELLRMIVLRDYREDSKLIFDKALDLEIEELKILIKDVKDGKIDNWI